MIHFFCLSSSIVPASVTNISNSIVVREGQNVTLVCHGFGLPAPRITWSDAWDVVMEDKNIWQLPKIHRNMTGEYICTASNACGNDSRKVDIDVQCESMSVLKPILPAVIFTYQSYIFINFCYFALKGRSEFIMWYELPNCGLHNTIFPMSTVLLCFAFVCTQRARSLQHSAQRRAKRSSFTCANRCGIISVQALLFLCFVFLFFC